MIPSSLPLQNAESLIALFDEAAAAQLGCRYRTGSCVNLPSRGHLLATGDLHDNPVNLEKAMRVARLADGPERHIVLHELIHGDHLINGMDFSYRMLGRVARLVIDAPDQVHPVLANHELSQLTRRAVSKGAGNSVELFNDALEFVFGDQAGDVEDAIDRFIGAMPLAVRTEGGVLCAHSLPSAKMMSVFDPGVLDRPLTDADFEAPHGSAHLMTWGRRYNDEQVDKLAERWGVRLFCLGHQHVETGIEIYGTRVVILNSDHDRAMVLPIDLAAIPRAAEAPMYAVPLVSVA